jgi:DNA-binding PadR family transcriptional regulator
MSSPSPESMLPLTPAVYHILLAVADGAKHGYAIMQIVTEFTHGEVEMGPGTLYGTLKRMVNASLIQELPAPPEEADERRRYYRATEFGEKVTRAETRRLMRLVDAARQRQLLEGDA